MKYSRSIHKWSNVSVNLTIVMLNKFHTILIFRQSDHLIQIMDKNDILNNKQCRSRSVGFFRSQLIWVYTVCKGKVYPGSEGQGLIILLLETIHSQQYR